MKDGNSTPGHGKHQHDLPERPLHQVAHIEMGTSPPSKSYNSDGSGDPLLNGPTEFTEKFPVPIQWTTSAVRFCKPGDILICVRGSSTGRMNIADQRYAIGRGVASIRAKDGKATTEFLQQVLEFRTRAVLDLAAGSTFPSIDRKAIDSFPVCDVTLSEQKSIAAVLSVWDRAIGQTAALIAAKAHLKQGLMQQLLSGKRRFPEFRRQKLQPTRLADVLTKIAKAITVDPSKSYREIGIRSHGKGIFHKDPVEGRTLGNKRVYEVVPGCLTLNIVFAWERALAVTTNDEAGMIASHRFPMFQPDPKRIAIEFVLHYMLSDVGHNVLKLASPGGAGRNRTISQEQFLKTSIPLPSVAEQNRIVAFINAADGELRSLKSNLQSLKKQKRGLMQRLLTGNVRVPKSLLKRVAKS